MTYINITNFVLISLLEKDHSMIETCCLKNVIFFQTIINAVKKNVTKLLFCFFNTFSYPLAASDVSP